MTEFIWNPTTTKLLTAALLGALIGLEREIAGKDPSLRTFSLLCLGSCMFTILSVHSALGVPNAEPSRIAAQILPGIGFLGAGTIFRSHLGISGLTTAALMWVTAAIGMAVGFDRLDIATTGAITALIVIVSFRLVHSFFERFNPPESDEKRMKQDDSAL